MGGLDCRYLTTHLTHRSFNVLSVTTIATPHRGSYFADHFLSTLGPDRLPNFLSLLDLLPNGGGDGKAFECLTLDSMRKFNEETPDVEGVKYFSWGAVYEPGLIDTWK
jgi:triacylglycerol lipase